ncbi:hypothetical protein C6P45_003844 [Maudiozyma exigua]|uniref:Uncharacterized protein n=1 Tax=Maudiozyma exigua TaxID=34358 RepID=A0A9P6VRM6_MAUEX|nr:hypothetical protein C6P45_003844 [Kazachstania exigua]
MFEIPVVDGDESGKTYLAERKLRYRYFNQSHKQHQKFQKENVETNEIQRDEDEDEDDGEHRHNHEERQYYKRYEKPQNSYEIWRMNNKKRKRTALQTGTMSYQDIEDIEEYGKRKIQHLQYTHRKLVEQFQNRIDGYEIIESSKKTTVHNIDLKVIQTLTELLHLNIIRKKWNTAYSIFSRMIRIPLVDIRSIWNLGVEIMSHANYSSEKPNQPMVLEFLEWMTKVYSSRAKYIEGINHKLAPVFRSGSKDHTAIYVTTFLWRSLHFATKQALENHDNDSYEDVDDMNQISLLQSLIERIDDILIIPTYMEESEVWFIQAMCHLVKTEYLTKRYSMGSENGGSINKNIHRNGITSSINSTERCLKECLNRNNASHGIQYQFEFPDRYIRRQLRLMEERLE